MTAFFEQVDSWIIALGYAGAMMIAWIAGWLNGRRLPPEPGQDPGVKFTDSSMALLGLLLGFTFSMSLTRHEHRRAMVVSESNSIGDFYTCASLLKGPHRTELQSLIRDYANIKLGIVRDCYSGPRFKADMIQVGDIQNQMVKIVQEVIHEGTPIVVPLTNTLNGIASSNSLRLAAYRDRLPWSIMLLLVLTSVVPAYLMGRQQGSCPKLHISGTVSFIFLVTAVFFVTLDLNLPTRGTITVSQEPMERLIESMNHSD